MSSKEGRWIEICPGIRRRTLTHGRHMYQMQAELEAGARMPEHQHVQEQIVHVVKGRVRFSIEGEERELGAGDSVYLASNQPHGVSEAIEATSIVDTFSPPREDYIAMDAAE